MQTVNYIHKSNTYIHASITNTGSSFEKKKNLLPSINVAYIKIKQMLSKTKIVNLLFVYLEYYFVFCLYFSAALSLKLVLN